MNSDVVSQARPVPGPAPDGRRPARPGRRPRPGSPAPPPKSPVRPASPVRPPGPGRSGRPAGTSGAGQPDRQRSASAPAAKVRADRRPAGRRPAAWAAQGGQARRTSFVLLLLGLLGGGLVCLLVVNTTLSANSLEIINLQKQNAVSSEQVQELQQQVAAARSDSTIAKEARRLGMRPDPELIFIDLRTKRIEAPRGAVAAALAARLAAGWPAGWPKTTGKRSGARRAGKRAGKKATAGRRREVGAVPVTVGQPDRPDSLTRPVHPIRPVCPIPVVRLIRTNRIVRLTDPIRPIRLRWVVRLTRPPGPGRGLPCRRRFAAGRDPDRRACLARRRRASGRFAVPARAGG